MIQKFWDSAMALTPIEDDDDSQRLDIYASLLLVKIIFSFSIYLHIINVMPAKVP